MRIAVLCDVHGNLPSLKAALASDRGVFVRGTADWLKDPDEVSANFGNLAS